MTFFWLLMLSITTSIWGGNRNAKIEGKFRIYGGELTEVEKVPYLAQVLKNRYLLCGASIISRHWLLTAAHCIRNHGDGLSIMTGSKYPQKGGEIHEIDEIIVHALYNPEGCENDIALIRVQAPIKFKATQRPIRIISRAPRIGEVAKVSGFGKEGKSGELSSTLKSTDIPIVSPEECKMSYSSKIVTEKILCVGWMHKGQPDTCQGDSGDPAVIDGELAGIVSSGGVCESSETPGIYTLIYVFRDWIKTNTGVVLEEIP